MDDLDSLRLLHQVRIPLDEVEEIVFCALQSVGDFMQFLSFHIATPLGFDGFAWQGGCPQAGKPTDGRKPTGGASRGSRCFGLS
jgi:hypothetical protein